MDDRPADAEPGSTDIDSAGAAPFRWANGRSDWWSREAQAWTEPEPMDLLATLSTHLSLRLGSGLLAEDTLLG